MAFDLDNDLISLKMHFEDNTRRHPQAGLDQLLKEGRINTKEYKDLLNRLNKNQDSGMMQGSNRFSQCFFRMEYGEIASIHAKRLKDSINGHGTKKMLTKHIA
jgi:hypothetical protein